MIPPDAETDLRAALQSLGTGSFPVEWKSTIIQAAAVICRLCGQSSVHSEEAKRILFKLDAIAPSGILGPGWESPRDDMASVLKAAIKDASTGALWRGIWDAKNGTCLDVLEQAEDLLLANYLAAAAVLSGGALEAHLKDLCGRTGLQWSGDGSISKYQSALSSAQRNGTISFFSGGDSKQVLAWGDLRNRAAHNPASIQMEDSVAITNMISGIRDFINRVP